MTEISYKIPQSTCGFTALYIPLANVQQHNAPIIWWECFYSHGLRGL